MPHKLKSADKVVTREDDEGPLPKRPAYLVAELEANNRRLRMLLEEAVAQLGKTDDEYHSDLRDKIIKEIGE